MLITYRETNVNNSIFKPIFPPPNKSTEQQHSPRPAGQTHQIPMLVSHKFNLSQPPASVESSGQKSDIHPEPSSPRPRSATERPPQVSQDEDIPPSLSQPPTTPRSYFAAAVTRVSQVFNWKNVS